MKILVAGTGDFCARLVARLNRERHDVYVIQGKSHGRGKEDTADFTPAGCTRYEFALDDEKLDFVFSSVMPDAVIFLGALDENFNWELSQRGSADYLSGLSNLLCLASAHAVRRFVYLSSSEVYGSKYGQAANESMMKAPENVKSIVISQGEDLCAGFNNSLGLQMVALRLDNVFGLQSVRAPDFASRLFAEAEATFGLTAFPAPEDKIFCPTYVSDAVDAVYKAAVKMDSPSGLYNVSGEPVRLSQAYLKICEIIGIEPEKTAAQYDAEEDIPSHTVSSELFGIHYGYRPIVPLEIALVRMRKNMQRAQKRKKRSDFFVGKSRILKIIAPFIENSAVFLLMAFLHLVTRNNSELSQIDFMVMYVIIISVTFGLLQASIAVVLTSIFLFGLQFSTGGSLFDMVTNVESILRLLHLFIIAVICGHMKDKARITIAERDQSLGDVGAELDTIYSINDRNMKIKKMLDNRLTNYENSLAKIYAITDKLNALRPDEVFFSAITAVADIMDSGDISIYIVTDSQYPMCRLVARSPQSDRALKKSLPFTDLGEMGEFIRNNEIYVNRDLDPDLPMMAAPVFSGLKLVSIIMVWTARFEQLTTYQINNLMVLSRLISSNIEKAYEYTRDVNASTHLENTGVLKPDAYRQILEVHSRADKEGVASHFVFHVDISALSLEQAARAIKPLLRATDYLGQGEDGSLYILLTNTNKTDAAFVYDRLQKIGISLREVAP